jgi:DNA polymerase-3 subunit beta
MKLSVTQENLNKALAAVSRVASSKTPLPVLNNILLRTDNNRLIVAATNLEVAIVQHIGAKVETGGAVTVPARLMSEFISNLPKANVELHAEGPRLHIKSGNFSSTINGVEAEEFPEIPTISEPVSVTVDTDVFKRAVSQTVISASSDNTRPILTGIYIHSFEGNLFFVGTDGYRLSERRLAKSDIPLNAVVPATTMSEVMRVIPDGLDSIEMEFDDSQVHFKLGDIEVTSRLIDGAFPDYRKLIPDKTEITVDIEKGELSRVVKVASLFARDSGGSITLKADENTKKLVIHSVASQLGENTSEADAKITGDGHVTLNSRYVLEALGTIDANEIIFGFSGRLAATVFRSSAKDRDYQHIVMPLKS